MALWQRNPKSTLANTGFNREQQRQTPVRYDERSGRTAYTDRDIDIADHSPGHDTPNSQAAYQKFGGANFGAAFFGWLVANSVTVLMVALLTALGSAVALSRNLNQQALLGNADTIGLSGAIGLLITLALAYYAGGYVAGRMSRFDGARQGIAVWTLGLVITIALAAAGAALGANYNLLQQLNLPSIPVDGSSFTTAGLLTMLAGLIVTALAAMAGGKMGERYHHRVDRAAGIQHGHLAHNN